MMTRKETELYTSDCIYFSRQNSEANRNVQQQQCYKKCQTLVGRRLFFFLKFQKEKQKAEAYNQYTQTYTNQYTQTNQDTHNQYNRKITDLFSYIYANQTKIFTAKTPNFTLIRITSNPKMNSIYKLRDVSLIVADHIYTYHTSVYS